MANLNSIAKKLQKAILQKGLVIKMGTSQFYSVEQNRLITMYILSTRVLERKKNGEWKYYEYEIIRTASQIEIVKNTSYLLTTVQSIRSLPDCGRLTGERHREKQKCIITAVRPVREWMMKHIIRC